MKLIKKYFPNLTERQLIDFQKLPELYQQWNAQINVISRQDIQNIEERHIVHSLSIIERLDSLAPRNVLDLGTGGGFPGIPLAIYAPQVNFHLIDGTKKKIHVVQNIIGELRLNNAKAEHLRAENLIGKYDLIVTRAVADISILWTYSQKLLSKSGVLLALKGGEIAPEISKLPKNLKFKIENLSDHFSEDFFKEKKIIQISKV